MKLHEYEMNVYMNKYTKCQRSQMSTKHEFYYLFKQTCVISLKGHCSSTLIFHLRNTLTQVLYFTYYVFCIYYLFMKVNARF